MATAILQSKWRSVSVFSAVLEAKSRNASQHVAYIYTQYPYVYYVLAHSCRIYIRLSHATSLSIDKCGDQIHKHTRPSVCPWYVYDTPQLQNYTSAEHDRFVTLLRLRVKIIDAKHARSVASCIEQMIIKLVLFFGRF